MFTDVLHGCMHVYRLMDRAIDETFPLYVPRFTTDKGWTETVSITDSFCSQNWILDFQFARRVLLVTLPSAAPFQHVLQKPKCSIWNLAPPTLVNYMVIFLITQASSQSHLLASCLTNHELWGMELGSVPTGHLFHISQPPFARIKWWQWFSALSVAVRGKMWWCLIKLSTVLAQKEAQYMPGQWYWE